MNYRNAHNVHFNLWSCISSLPFWKLSILNCISVLWSQSQHLFAHSLILSFLSTKYCAGLNRAASRNTVTSSPVDNLKLQKPHWREGRRLGIPAWALGHKGRTSSLTKNRTRSKKLWKMPLYYLYAKSQIFQLFSTLFCQLAISKWHLSPVLQARDNHHMASAHYLVPGCQGHAFPSRCISLSKHL